MRRRAVCTQGFSIVELIVTISILVVINTVVFANYPKFRQSISLRMTGQEIASTIYQAQTYALSVKEFTTLSGEEKFPGYGAHFDILDGPADSFVLFADLKENPTDLKGNDKYDGELEKVEEFKIQTGDRIFELCGTKETEDCSLNMIDIIFLRPNPVVTLTTDGIDRFSNIKIKIKSLQEQTKTINIWLSGQISVE